MIFIHGMKRKLKKLALAALPTFAFLLSTSLFAVTPIKDIKLTGTASQISSGTFTIQSGVIFNAVAGSTITISGSLNVSGATSFTVGTLTSATNANIVLDPNGTGALELLANTYIGSAVTTPTAFLHLDAGTAAAGTAPLKLAAGVLLTTPESGTINFDGSFFYGTNSTPTRQRFSTDAAAAAIAASDINWSLSAVFTKTLAANTTFTFSNTVDGRTIVVALTNTASNYTVTWPTVLWSGSGTAPTQTIGAKTDIYTFIKIGSVIYGSAVQNF